MSLSDRAAATYARGLAAQFGPGSLLAIRRTVSGVPTDYPVNGWVIQVAPSDVVGSVQQLSREAIILAADVVASGFPLPFLPKQDRIVWNGKALAITSIDEGSRAVQGTVLAYVLKVAGA